jgi:hypothetical protein
VEIVKVMRVENTKTCEYTEKGFVVTQREYNFELGQAISFEEFYKAALEAMDEKFGYNLILKENIVGFADNEESITDFFGILTLDESHTKIFVEYARIRTEEKFAEENTEDNPADDDAEIDYRRIVVPLSRSFYEFLKSERHEE